MDNLNDNSYEGQAVPGPLGSNDNKTKPADGLPISEMVLDSIIVDPGLQSRENLDEDVVAEYAELLAIGHRFPPVVVFVSNGEHLLADGFHRYEAHRKAGKTDISVDIREGGRSAALLFSVGANAKHGLHRTNKDKKRAVSLLLADPEWKGWSNIAIAKACGVSDRFVGSIRKSTPNGSESPTIRKTGKDAQTMNVENIGPEGPSDAAEEEEQREAMEESKEPSLGETRRKLKKLMQSLLTALDKDKNVTLVATDELITELSECLVLFREQAEDA